MQLLKDSDGSRKIKGLPLPPSRFLPSQMIFQQEKINWLLIKDFLKKQGRISKSDFMQLIRRATQLFRNQPTLLKTQDPLTIVGDIHGQYYDLIKLIQVQIGGCPSTTKYLFLGDYVDRGSFSIQVLLLILSLKISFPKSILMLRGNHQCRQLTGYFNFKQQTLYKYDQEVYQAIMVMFDCLPLACLVNARFLCVHGGISQELQQIQDISYIDRFREVPKTGLFCDLLWADPVDHKDGHLQKIVKANTARGCSYFFGYELAKNLFAKNKIISIIRAHEAQAQGFKMHKWSGNDKFPAVITIFSAPNYCDFYNNKGAVIKFEDNTLNVQQFVQSPHPYLLPNFMDLFTWSIPFMTQKIMQMLYFLLKPNKQIDQNMEYPYQLSGMKNLVESILQKQKQQVKTNLQLINLGGNCPDQKLLETGLFSSGKKKSFADKKHIDQKNQQRPSQEIIL